MYHLDNAVQMYVQVEMYREVQNVYTSIIYVLLKMYNINLSHNEYRIYAELILITFIVTVDLKSNILDFWQVGLYQHEPAFVRSALDFIVRCKVPLISVPKHLFRPTNDLFLASTRRSKKSRNYY